MASEEFELATAYVRILPTVLGLKEAIQKELVAAGVAGAGKLGTELEGSTKGVKTGLAKAFSGSSGYVATLGKVIRAVFLKGGKFLKFGIDKVLIPIGERLTETLRHSAEAFKESLRGAGSILKGVALGIGVGIGDLVLKDGLEESLSLNQSQTKIKALGVSASQYSGIMAAAKDATEGTVFTMADASNTAAGFLAAGLKPGAQFNGLLASTSKLAQRSGQSFGKIGSILGKSAATGSITAQALSMLNRTQAGVLPQLAKNLGVTQAQVKKLATQGKISFGEFNKAVGDLSFKSAYNSTENITLAFKKIKKSLAEFGSGFFDPIIKNLGPFLADLNEFFEAVSKSFNFTKEQNKLGSFTKNLDKIFDRFKNKEGEFDPKKIKAFFDTLETRFKTFKAKLGQLESPLKALSIVKLLGGLPFVGETFKKFSAPIIVVGALFKGMYDHSQALRDALHNLVGTIKALAKDIFGAFNLHGGGKDFLATAGDSVAGFVNNITSAIHYIVGFLAKSNFIEAVKNIFTNVVDFIKGFASGFESKSKPLIDAFKNLFGAVSGALSGLGGKGKGGAPGKSLGATIATVLTAIVNAIAAVVPIVKGIASTVLSIITSNFIKDIIGWIVDAATYLSKHKHLLDFLLGVLAGWFIVKKFSGPIEAMFNFFSKIGPKAAVAAVEGEEVGAGAKVGLGSMLKGFNSLAGQIFKAILIVGGIILFLSIIGKIVEKTGLTSGIKSLVKAVKPLVDFLKDELIDVIKKLGVFLATTGLQIVNGLVALIPKLQPFISFLVTQVLRVVKVLGPIFVKIVDIIVKNLPRLGMAISGIINALANLAKNIFDGITGLIDDLAKNGVQAGAGAAAAAGGIALLLASLTAGTVVHAAGNLGSSLLNLGSGLVDKANNALTGSKTDKEKGPIAQIEGLASAFASLSKQSWENIPNQWGAIADSAPRFGADLINGTVLGINTALPNLHNALYGQIVNELNLVQDYMDKNPLVVRTDLDKKGVKPAGFTTAVASGNGTTINQKNYAVTVKNNDSLKSLQKAAR